MYKKTIAHPPERRSIILRTAIGVFISAVLGLAPVIALATTYSGTSGNDAIVGTSGADTITLGNGGFDYANGRDGNDRITKVDGGHTMMLGGVGNDFIRLSTTTSNALAEGWIHGESGDDKIEVVAGSAGNSLHAVVYGGSGRDTLFSSDATAELHGGSGNDNISVGGEGSFVVYGDGNDDTILVTSDSANTAYGGTGNDNLQSGHGTNTMYGEDGNDIFTSSGDSFNTFYGGSGADKFICSIDALDILADYNAAEGDTIVNPQYCDKPQTEIPVSIVPGSTSKTIDAFSPNPVNVNVNDTVTWTNDDSTIHTVTSGSSGTPDNNFDSSNGGKTYLAPKQTFSHTFDAAGDYPYYCTVHPNMVGMIRVES